MATYHSVAVFCGSRHGALPVWQNAAIELGQGLAAQQIRLVYGGGNVGLMGTIANAALDAGGQVIGIIPEFLIQIENAHPKLAALEVTDSMHNRKRRMFELADAFVTFAGGLGTLDETFEILTWKQLRLHNKPILICDVAGSARGLLATIEQAIEQGFAQPQIRDLYECIDGVPALLARLA